MEGEKTRSNAWAIVGLLCILCVIIGVPIAFGLARTSAVDMEHERRLAEIEKLAGDPAAVEERAREADDAFKELKWWHSMIEQGTVTRNSPGYLAAKDRCARSLRR